MRTQANLERLVQELQHNCGDLFAAARSVGLSLVFVQQWKKDDKDVAELLAEAERVGNMGLLSAAITRAVHGVEKGVYFKGDRVDSERVYSDGLLSKLLEAKIPEFSKREDVLAGLTNNGNVQINIMPRAENYNDWLAMKDATLTRRAKLDALPAPVVTIEATATERLPDIL